MYDKALLTALAPVGAFKCEPMTVNEIDAHPDADRIWATVAALRSCVDAAEDEMRERAEEAEEQAKWCEAGRDKAMEEIERLEGEVRSLRARLAAARLS